jgi:hypothetical protein
MSEAARLKSTLYVGGLAPAVTAQTLHAAFVPFGDIADISLPKPELASASREPHRGFGYVEFESAADAAEARDNLDQSELFGRVIKVAAAKPQKEATEGLGSKIAVWEQVCGDFILLGFWLIFSGLVAWGWMDGRPLCQCCVSHACGWLGQLGRWKLFLLGILLSIGRHRVSSGRLRSSIELGRFIIRPCSFIVITPPTVY